MNNKPDKSIDVVSLTKFILPTTQRYFGLRCPNIPPQSIPIAGQIHIT